ncbi:MAG: PIN domain-containing protein [Verrucomicrobia bacterium]|nr:PIN domain-containing protein [Verrucomicrobiota bacterium]
MAGGSPCRFIDTNVLLYAYDLESPRKRARAKGIVARGWEMLGESAISVQVLQELQVNLERKKVSRGEIHQLIDDLSVWPVVDNTLMILKMALAEQVRWHLSLGDAMILAAARSVGVSELVTEDFSHGQNYGGVRAVNPFR